MKKPKSCKFCPTKNYNAVYAPIDDMERHGAHVFFCHACQAEYIYFADGICACTSLYTTINNKMYRWTVTSVGTGNLSYIGQPGIPGVKKNDQIQTIKYFDPQQGHKVHHLTPQNVQEKLKIWLLFL